MSIGLRVLLLLPFLVGLTHAQQVPATRGQVLYRNDFESSNALADWTGTGIIESGLNGGKALAIEAPAGKRGSTVSRSLPAQGWQGCTVRGTAMIRAREVSAKPNAWNGIKLMLVLQSPRGISYPQAPIETGSFDWRKASLRVLIPEDTTNVFLVLGLEEVAGKVWFDDLEFKVDKAPTPKPPPVLAGPVFKGHNLDRLRGAMVSPNIDAAGLKVLGRDWKANLIRFQLIRSGRIGQTSTLADYDQWLEGELQKLDRALPRCEEYGLKVVVDLHSPPGGKATQGGYMGSDAGLFQDPKAQERFVQLWRDIALRYKGAKAIWGYDIANEPVEEDVAEDCEDWQGLAERAARAIRSVDPERAIIVEPTGWGGPDGFKDLIPVPVSNVVYSVHMYVPHTFTHQGVFEQGPSWDYPGEIQGKLWNRAELERALQPVIDFQRRYRAHIYAGEFSAIRWAPNQSAERYLSEVIEIFESHGWDWSYHAFREWQGWSVEHGELRAQTAPADSSTRRQNLLREWFEKNQNPPR